MPSWEEQVLDAAIARLLADPRTPTGTTATAVLMPDRDYAYALNLTTSTEGEQGGSEVVAVLQVRAKGTADPRTTFRLAEIARDAFHLQDRYTLGPARVARSWRQSHGTIGLDSRGRVETSSNFYMHTARPTPGVTD